MSQRRSSYSNSGDFNLDDLFRPEPGPAGQSPEQAAVPQQQAAPPVPGQGGPEYWGPPSAAPAAPQAEAAPETQYLPPYPTADPNVGGPGRQPAAPGFGAPQGGQTFGGQQPGQTFGGQPAAPAFGAPQGGQTFGGQPAAPAQPAVPPYPGQPAGAPGYGDQGFGAPQGGQSFGGQSFPAQPAAAPGYGDQGYGAPQGGQSFGGQQFPAQGYQQQAPSYQGSEGSGGRPNQKLIIGGVIAGCAAAGILVAVLMSGGGDDKSGNQPQAAKTSAAPVATGSAGAVSPEAKAQAQALSDLLGTANSSRQAVVGAVAAVGRCENLPDAQAKLTAAAGQRQDLVTKLSALKVDQLPDGAKLADQLKTAWQASATADTEYAAWAGDGIAGCDPAKIKDNPHLKNANDASGTATTAKTQASDLWNAIAGRTGLPTKDKLEL